jgi:hypothetical protein
VQPCIPLRQFLLTVLNSLCTQIPIVLHSLAKSQSSKLLSRMAMVVNSLGNVTGPVRKAFAR